ncbi:hypothetical protein [Streptomyces rimosus]|uniref:hypothetical protein n=1 Tax=Streptomyces rimosus TaxID=1927 RepID=UPI0021004069|nr:hypothetical protein [Streptomyces rimosus]
MNEVNQILSVPAAPKGSPGWPRHGSTTNVPISSFYLEMRAAQYVWRHIKLYSGLDMCLFLEKLSGHQLAAMNDPKNKRDGLTACSSEATRRDALSKLSTAATRAERRSMPTRRMITPQHSPTLTFCSGITSLSGVTRHKQPDASFTEGRRPRETLSQHRDQWYRSEDAESLYVGTAPS